MRRFAHFLSIGLLTAAVAWPQASTSRQTRDQRRDAKGAQQQKPLEEPPPPEPYNQLDSNETLFYVLAAINAAGYDEQADSSTNNPLRARIREYLAKQNLKSLLPLRRYVRDHKPKNPGAELGQLGALGALGVTVTGRVPVIVPPNQHSARYLEAKRQRMEHDLPDDLRVAASDAE